ncbi:TonB-dependent receptor plug domain-containing protein [Parabacteroides sp. PFB2-10]|uniref:TonB-dependent receptor plug domain-containing protein n=1 Tax=Parabacteroides sp. PFB2-10 TaxID=1742405 RepID=UPI002476FFDA|nr:TonB-dependent receptor plug domain-containing protein [Parabacteroides sp. PFB2-10]
MRKTILFLTICFHCINLLNAQSQTPVSPERVMEQMEIQTDIFPIEKLYLHIDRNAYFQGEDIWFKAYLRDAFLRPSETGSRYVYVELINPLDSVVGRVMTRPQEGLFHGNLPVSEELAEGFYTLKAYTRYMENWDESCFFRKTIEIKSVLGAQIRPHYNFHYQNDEKKVDLTLYYTAGTTDQKIKPDRLLVRNKRGDMQNIRLDRDTIAHISFDLPLKNDQRAVYLESDRFRHFIFIPYETDDYDVALFPEGGYLLNGCLTRVAFKAIDSQGQGEEITGTVYNQQGNYVCGLQTSHAGMGLFAFFPREGETYYAECINSQGVKKRFDLPQAVSGTYGLQADALHGSLYIGLQHTKSLPLQEDLYLLIHQNGRPLYFEPWKKDKQELRFSWESLSPGILQVVLFDQQMRPLAERLVFSPLKNKPQFVLQTDKSDYRTREKVSLSMWLTEAGEAPLQGDFSVAITDDADVVIDTMQTIVSTLLLSSELKGTIESPASYLQENNPKANLALDLLMMTQGWRRYDLSEVLQGNYTYPEVLPETGIQLTGQVSRISSKKAIQNGEVTLMMTTPKGETHFGQVRSNENGNFAFPDMEYPDSTRFFVQSLNQKGLDYVELHIDNIRYPLISALDRINIRMKREPVRPVVEQNFKKAEERAMYDDNMKVIHLKEVTVVAAKPVKKEESRKSAYASMGTTVINFMDKIKNKHYSNFADVFFEIPGVQVVTDGSGNTRLVIRGAGSMSGNSYALIMINDMPVDYPDVLQTISMHDVASVEVYKGADAAIFGVRGGSGAVNILTKTGEDYMNNPVVNYNKQVVYPLGYQRPVEFYSPKYETPEQKSSYLPDLRTTIYWKPDLTTDENGETTVSFYTADIPSTYSILIEGITDDGKPVRHIEKIQVR